MAKMQALRLAAYSFGRNVTETLYMKYSYL